MTIKGTIKSDHIPVNKFEMLVIGLPPLTVITVGGLEEETQSVEMPDRTAVSGGNSGPIEFDVTTPAHHLIEQALWEAWFLEGKDPVMPTYKKAATLILKSLSGTLLKTWTLNGVWVKKRTTPELDMANEGEDARVTWTLSADESFPV